MSFPYTVYITLWIFNTGRSAGNFEDVRENARNDNDEFRAIGGTTHNDVAARIVPGAPTASTASRYVPPTRSLEDLYKEDNDHQNYYMEIPGGDMEVAISGPGVEKQLQFEYVPIDYFGKYKISTFLFLASGLK